jgi:lipopolysaccharide/colanic/teichoic acid biosynthesis glycosyltransferase
MAYVLRRSSDVTLAMLLLFLFAPFFLVVALLIKLSNCGPVFFVLQPRVGKDFKLFSVLKFRTMVRGADRPPC